MIKYRHKGNGKIYELIDGFTDVSIKQTSDNEWENAVGYIDVETFQPYVTGEKRFNERFELVKEDT